jgi:LysM repeat protein
MAEEYLMTKCAFSIALLAFSLPIGLGTALQKSPPLSEKATKPSFESSPISSANLLNASIPLKVVVREGDTLLSIAQRHGTTMQEILRLNPGLDTARLVAGTEIYLVQDIPLRSRTLLATLSSANSDHIWVRVQQPVDLVDLARQLQVQYMTLASLNDVNVTHRFRQGDWLILPSTQVSRVRQVASLDSTNIQSTSLPHQASPPLQAKGVVRFGDTLMQIAQRYGVSMQEILRFNPGLDTARLVAGTEIQLASPPRQQAVLGLRPSTSGGLSWPDTSQNRPARPHSIQTQVKPLSEREIALLQQIRLNQTRIWRKYGKCRYNWSGWRNMTNDIRSTSADCGESREWTIGVSCSRLMVNTYTEQRGWMGWSKPAGPSHKTRSGEDEMVAALCANLSDQ